MLARHGLSLQDFDIYEIHEAFAAQVLCTLRAWESEDYCESARPVRRDGQHRPGQDQPARLVAGGRPSVRRDRRAHHRHRRQGWPNAAAAARWCPSAPPAAWAWWPSSSADGGAVPAMNLAATLGLFVLTALAEITGCWLPWLWLRQGRSAWLLLPAAISWPCSHGC
jgi:hypothetical protein